MRTETSREAETDDRGRSPERSIGAAARLEIPVGPLLAWLGRNRIAVILTLGVVFRVARYLANRSLWLDEVSLKGTITKSSLAGLFGPLSNSQLAPPGFLVVEWLVSRTLGESDLALRLFPLACGVASLFLFRRVSAAWLGPRAAELALALFAVSNDLVYYASELKQYSCDVALALVCDLEALALLGRPATAARLARFGALGAAAVWFSHPSAFVLAGLGTVLLVSAMRQQPRQWRRAAGLALMCATWAVSFAAVYLIAQEQLGHRRDMWKFWDFAFPPMPPRSFTDAAWVPRRVLYLFVNPMDFHEPLSPRLSFLPALGSFLAGCVAMVRRGQGTRFGMLWAPGAFVLLASGLHLYPFHGRLILFLVPSFLLLIAEGAAAAGEASGRRAVWAAIVVVLLAYPALSTVSQVIDPPMERLFTPFGDLRLPAFEPSRFPF